MKIRVNFLTKLEGNPKMVVYRLDVTYEICPKNQKTKFYSRAIPVEANFWKHFYFFNLTRVKCLVEIKLKKKLENSMFYTIITKKNPKKDLKSNNSSEESNQLQSSFRLDLTCHIRKQLPKSKDVGISTSRNRRK